MEFFIKKNATLPLLKMQVVKDGRSDYNHFMDMIEVSSLFFSMTNIETGIPKILTRPAGFVEKILVNPDAGPEYYIYYQFTNLDTNTIGRYEGQFMLKNNDGVLILPIREKLFINIVSPYAGNIIWWGDNYTGAYQYTTQHDRSWIHADQTTMWAGVCYLTPNAPYSSGTGLFRHKTSGLRAAIKNPDGSYDQDILSAVYKDSRDMTKWELMDVVGNVYNRLVIYRGDLFHMSLDYFGSDRYDGRLFQTFFFNTEH